MNFDKMLTNVTKNTNSEICFKDFFLYWYRDKNKRSREMAISYIHEALLFYTKQKTSIGNKLTSISMNMLSAGKKVADAQAKYNDKLNLIHNMYYEDDPDNYEILAENLQNEHEIELAQLNAWESKLENQKMKYENEYNVISANESSWMSLLKNQIKTDFSYGGKSS